MQRMWFAQGFGILLAISEAPHQVKAWCPPCRTWHIHGDGDVPGEEAYGYRRAHCRHGPFVRRGYVILKATTMRDTNSPVSDVDCQAENERLYQLFLQYQAKEASMVQHDALVKFYKDRGPGGNGAFAITTTAPDSEAFLSACAEELPGLLAGVLDGDWEFSLQNLLPKMCEIWAKLRGYKTDGIFERRLLIAGEPNPETHMDWLNPNEPSRLNGLEHDVDTRA